MYTLKKLKVEKGAETLIPEGYEKTLPFLMLIDYTDENYKKQLNDLRDIEIGRQVYLFSMREYHRTSKISEIVLKEKHKVVFKTQTSTYELVERMD